MIIHVHLYSSHMFPLKAFRLPQTFKTGNVNIILQKVKGHEIYPFML